MRNWKALFPAVAITLCSIAATARGGSISIPELGSQLPRVVLNGGSRQASAEEGAPTSVLTPALWFEEGGGSVRVSSAADRSAAVPVSAPLDQVPEPASMGLLGIGISGLIMLRRFRKLFS